MELTVARPERDATRPSSLIGHYGHCITIALAINQYSIICINTECQNKVNNVLSLNGKIKRRTKNPGQKLVPIKQSELVIYLLSSVNNRGIQLGAALSFQKMHNELLGFERLCTNHEKRNDKALQRSCENFAFMHCLLGCATFF
ncbi:conserved hypothetical protein [Trichinella spiralis]|uniref:hypothetical protein n=1 Tax=Trichinella spiralis TaxID=6334 RepID=UPI0001EFD089|nr:conserved hypothetical protein [Trichinella spiralis]